MFNWDLWWCPQTPPSPGRYAPGFAQADKEAPEALLRVDNTVLLGKITTTCLSQSEGLKELIADSQLSS